MDGNKNIPPPPAGFGRRCAAGTLDILWFWLIKSFLLLPVLNIFLATRAEVAAEVFLINGAGVLAYAVFDSSVWRATPGMRCCAIYVSDHAGGRLSFYRALGFEALFCLGCALCLVPLAVATYYYPLFEAARLFAACGAEPVSGQAACVIDVQSALGLNINKYYRILGTSLSSSALLALLWAVTLAKHPQKLGWHNRLSGVLCFSGAQPGLTGAGGRA